VRADRHDLTVVANASLGARARWAVLLWGCAWAGGAAAQSTPADEPLLKDARVGYNARTFYMDVDYPDGKSREAWTFGGKVYGLTGYWDKRLQFGASYYFSLPLYAPDDRDGTALLAPGQERLSVIGELFARLRVADEATLTVGRQEIDMSPERADFVRSNRSDATYVGRLDNRMVPFTYQAALLEGQLAAPLTAYAAWIDRAKPRNSNHFVPMGEAVGAVGSDSPMGFGGLQWTPAPGAMLQAWMHDVPDVLRIAFIDGDFVWPLGDKRYLRVAGQYTDQRSTGSNELEAGRPFATHNAQLYGEAGIDAVKLYGALSRTGEGNAIRTPFSSGPIYTQQVTRSFVDAGEKAWQVGLAFELGALLPGLSGWLDYTAGRDLIDAASGAALPDETETNLGLVWSLRQKGSLFDGLRARFRFAWVTDKAPTGNEDTTDLRVDINLPLRWL
jgi:hypothetical protein